MKKKKNPGFHILEKYRPWAVLAYALAGAYYTYHHRVWGELPDALVFYLGLPLLIILAFKGRLRDHGLTPGRWKAGLLWTLAFIVLAVITTWVAVHYMPGIRRYYAGEAFTLRLVGETLVYMAAWEFFFRGFLLFGLGRLGFAAANGIQTMLFFLMHIGKPWPELYSTLLTGLVFGYITRACGSVYPMILIHAAIFLSVVFFAAR